MSWCSQEHVAACTDLSVGPGTVAPGLSVSVIVRSTERDGLAASVFLGGCGLEVGPSHVKILWLFGDFV